MHFRVLIQLQKCIAQSLKRKLTACLPLTTGAKKLKILKVAIAFFCSHQYKILLSILC